MTNGTTSKYRLKRLLIDTAVLAALGLTVLNATGCPPAQQSSNYTPGKFIAGGSGIWGGDSDFNITDTVEYPTVQQTGMRTASMNIPDSELAMVRCEHCHECGFLQAWDWENFGSSKWSPTYVGEAWLPIVSRMMRLDNSFLQEEGLATRVYEYLRDESLGIYDPAADDKGAIIVEVDELPADPAAGSEIPIAEVDD